VLVYGIVMVMMMMMMMMINNNNKCTEGTKISSLAKFSIRYQQGNRADLTRNIMKVPRE